jgi:four helix bundle protein
MDGHRKLIVWRSAGDLIRLVYRVTKSLPPEEKYVATAQMRRAAWSVQNNIAEGNARFGPREMRRFLDCSLASLAEVDSMRCTLPTLYELDQRALIEMDAVRRRVNAGIFALLKRGQR